MSNPNINVSGPKQPASIYKTVVLKGDRSFASQVTEENTKYVIKHNFDLSDGAIVYEGWEIEGMGGNPSIIDGEEYWLTDYESGIAEPTIYNLVDKECFFVIDGHISDAKEVTLQQEENAWIATKRRGYHARILSHLDPNAAITIPAGCLLEFDGGSISNGTLVGNNTILIYNQALNAIFNNVDRQGTFIYNNTLSADEEDLTAEGNLVKFKNKEYNAANYSGLGRVFLRKNIINGVNTLTQEMLADTNTIYHIQYDYILAADITIPTNCVLQFEGGSIKNARGNSFKVTGTRTRINTDVAYNIFGDTLGGGFELPYIDLRWVGGVSDWNGTTGTDNAPFFTRALDVIGKYYDGLYVYLVGQYYIGTQVATTYNVNIWGSHNNSRHLLSGTEMSAVTSPSMIVVGNSVNAFYMYGRSAEGSTTAYAYFSLKNIKVQGTTNSTFIFYVASGSPSRVCVVEECEFTGLSSVFRLISTEDTIIGNLTVSKCDVYGNDKFIYASPDVGLTTRTLCNCVIKDSTIEQNGENCIYLERTFGSIIIDNNILEGQTAPIYIRPNISEVTISNNYFEENTGDAITVASYNSNSKLYFKGNHYESAITVNISNLLLYGNLNGLSDSSRIGNCYVEDIDNYKLKWLSGGNYGSHVVFDKFKTGVNYSYPLNHSFQVRRGNVIGRECPTTLQSVNIVADVADASKDLIIAFYVSGNGTIGFYNNGSGYQSGYSTYGLKNGGLVFYKALPYSTGENAVLMSNYNSGNILTVLGFVDEDASPSYVLVPDTNTILNSTTRPSFPDMPVGYAFFDKDISPNRIIYYAGNGDWVDTTGTPV